MISGLFAIGGGSIAGGTIGIILASRLRFQVMKRIFAAFLAVVAMYMLTQQA
ncbi:MAG: hypothetical protein ACRETB_05855 [Steroidobacteraceae bacterium]